MVVVGTRKKSNVIKIECLVNIIFECYLMKHCSGFWHPPPQGNRARCRKLTSHNLKIEWHWSQFLHWGRVWVLINRNFDWKECYQLDSRRTIRDVSEIKFTVLFQYMKIKFVYNNIKLHFTHSTASFYRRCLNQCTHFLWYSYNVYTVWNHL